jgi:hypothetical protein
MDRINDSLAVRSAFTQRYLGMPLLAENENTFWNQLSISVQSWAQYFMSFPELQSWIILR